MKQHDAKLGQLREAAEKNARAATDLAGHAEKQAKELTETKEIQTKILILQNRPRIIVRDATGEIEAHQEPYLAKVIFHVVNAGGSKAEIVDGEIMLRSGITPPVGNSEFNSGGAETLQPFTLQPGESRPISLSLDPRIDGDPVMWGNFLAGLKPSRNGAEVDAWIHLIGKITYKDELGIFRLTGFDRAYQPKTKSFYRWKEAEGEYED